MNQMVVSGFDIFRDRVHHNDSNMSVYPIGISGLKRMYSSNLSVPEKPATELSNHPNLQQNVIVLGTV